MADEIKLCECGCGGEVSPGKRFVKGHATKKKQESWPLGADTSKGVVGKALETVEVEAREHQPAIDDRFVVTRTDDSPMKRLPNPHRIDPKRLPTDSTGKPAVPSWQTEEHISTFLGLGYHIASPKDVKNWGGAVKENRVVHGDATLLLTTKENQDHVNSFGPNLAAQRATAMGFLPQDQRAQQRGMLGGKDNPNYGATEEEIRGNKSTLATAKSGVISTETRSMADAIAVSNAPSTEGPGG